MRAVCNNSPSKGTGEDRIPQHGLTMTPSTLLNFVSFSFFCFRCQLQIISRLNKYIQCCFKIWSILKSTIKVCRATKLAIQEQAYKDRKILETMTSLIYILTSSKQRETESDMHKA